MDIEPETLEKLVFMGKIGGILVGASAIATAGVLCEMALIIKHSERWGSLKRLRSLYEVGELDRKPTYWNVRSFYKPVEEK